MSLFIGTSGFSYRHFYSVFYPEGLPRHRMLEYYSQHFNSVELNVTFYRMPKEVTFKTWNRKTPDRFTFSIKANKRFTHLRRLNISQSDAIEFFNTIEPLKNKIGAILWQLPPSFKKNIERLKFTLELLKYTPYKHAFEFRHESWFNEEVYNLLNEYGCTFCFSDWPIDIQTDFEFSFYYIRRHGAVGDAPFARLYSEEEIKKDAQLVCRLLNGQKNVFFYYNNDTEGFAVINAKQLEEKVNELCPEQV